VLTQTGLLHPIIHLGFAIEFNQPAIVAEALAQTAVHDDWTGPRYLWPAERTAGGIDKRGEKTMLQLLEEARGNQKLARSAHWDDGNKLRDGVLKRAPDEMINIASQYTASEDQIQEKFVEMVNTSGQCSNHTRSCVFVDNVQSTSRVPHSARTRSSSLTFSTFMP
jgi:hypothetical protein